MRPLLFASLCLFFSIIINFQLCGQGSCVSDDPTFNQDALILPSTTNLPLFRNGLGCFRYDTIFNSLYNTHSFKVDQLGSFFTIADLDNNILFSNVDSLTFEIGPQESYKITMFETEDCYCTPSPDGFLSSGDYAIECIDCPEEIPLNDLCVDAMELIPSTEDNCSFSEYYTTGNATGSGGFCSIGNNDIWFKFTATKDSLTFFYEITYGSNEIEYELLSGSCGQMSHILCGTNNQIFSGLEVDSTYFIRIKSQSDSEYSYLRLCISENLPPSNDLCSDAIEIIPSNTANDCGTSTIVGTTGFSTFDLPQCSYSSGPNDVWYKFTATQDHHIVKVDPTGFQQIGVEIFDGCGGQRISCSNYKIHFLYDLIIGNTYFIRIFADVNKEFEICISHPDSPPINDDCSSSISITPVNSMACQENNFYSNENATFSNNACIGISNDDVWFDFTATHTSHIISLDFLFDIYTLGEKGIASAYLEVFSGSCDSLISIGCSSDPYTIVNNLVVGQKYYYKVYSFFTNGYFSFYTCVGTPPSPPINDECTGAVEIFPNLNTFCLERESASTIGATGSDTTSCGFTFSDDNVWFKFKAISDRHSLSIHNEQILLNLYDDNDFTISVFSDSCSMQNLVVCDVFINASNTANINTLLVNNLTIGEYYHVAVNTVDLNTYANFEICLSTPPKPPANDECENSINLSLSEDPLNGDPISGTTYYSTFDSLSNLCFTGKSADVWYDFTATSTDMVLALSDIKESNFGEDDYDLPVAIYSGSCDNLEEEFCGFIQSVHLESLDIDSNYLVQIRSNFTDYKDFSICVKEAPLPPINDECSNAIPLFINDYGLCDSITSFTTYGATRSISDHSFYKGDDDVWFSFIPDTSSLELLVFDRVQQLGVAGFRVELYLDGCDEVDLVESYFSWNPTLDNLLIGNQYYLRIYTTDQESYAAGSICLSKSVINTSCDNAFNIQVTDRWNCNYNNPGSSIGAPSYKIWFKFIAEYNSQIISLMEYSAIENIDIQLTSKLYSGTCNNLILKTSSNSGNYIIGENLNIGETYYVEFDSYLPYFFKDVCIREYVEFSSSTDCENPVFRSGTSPLVRMDSISFLPGENEIHYLLNLNSGASTTRSYEVVIEDFITTNSENLGQSLLPDDISISVVDYDNPFCIPNQFFYRDINQLSFGNDIDATTDQIKPEKHIVFRTEKNISGMVKFKVNLTIDLPGELFPVIGESCSNTELLNINTSDSCNNFTQIDSIYKLQSFISCDGSNSADDDVWTRFIPTSERLRIHIYDVENPLLENKVWINYRKETSCTYDNQEFADCLLGNEMILEDLEIGQTYQLRTYTNGAGPSAKSRYKICIHELPSEPSNDEFTNAITVTPGSTLEYLPSLSKSGTTKYASQSMMPCEGYKANDVWYSFTANSVFTHSHLSNIDEVDLKIVQELFDINTMTSLGCFEGPNVRFEGLSVNSQYLLRIYEKSAKKPFDFNINIIGYDQGSFGCSSSPINIPASTSNLCINAIRGSNINLFTSLIDCSVDSYCDSKWYTFIASEEQHVLSLFDISPLSDNAIDAQLVLGIYDECNDSTYIKQGESSIILEDLVVGNNYFVRVGDKSFTVDVGYNFYMYSICNFPLSKNSLSCNSAEEIPLNLNDECANYFEGLVSYSTNETNCSTDYGNGKWLKSSTLGYEKINIKRLESELLSGQNHDLDLKIFKGTNCSTKELILCSSESIISVNGLSGYDSLFIHVSTVDTNTISNVKLCLTIPSSPTNDECFNSVVLNVNDASSPDLFSTKTSTFEGSQSFGPCLGNSDDDVWFTFTATSAAHEIHLFNEFYSLNNDILITQVFSGICNNLLPLSCSDQNKISLSDLVPGSPYTIRIYTEAISTFADFTIAINTPFDVEPPVNDDSENSINLYQSVNSDCNIANSFSTTFFGASPSNISNCAGISAYDVWYSFTANSSTPTIEVTGSVDLVIELRDSLNSLIICKNSSQGNSEILESSGLTIGSKYLVRVYPYSNSFSIPTSVYSQEQSYFNICIFGPPVIGSNGLPLEGTVLPTEVGYTPGSFTVSETGSALYNIKFKLPSGLTGMKPSVGITYNSNGGDGVIGSKFALNGLSMITREGRDIDFDDEIAPISFTNMDVYNLDGQRLVNWSSLDYGSDNCEYRTENQSFKRIKSYGEVFPSNTPEKFKVWTKDGLIYEYGYTEDSKIEAVGRNDIAYWLVNKISDSKGNYIEFVYEEDPVNGYYYPMKILYTANDSFNITPPYEIRFKYEKRPDIRENYIAGSRSKTIKRLKQVDVMSDTSSIRSYHLKYQQDNFNGTSQLISLQEYGMYGECLNPTIFEWEKSSSFLDISQRIKSNPIPKSGFKFAVDIKEHWILVGWRTHKNLFRKKTTKTYQKFIETNVNPLRQDLTFDGDFDGDGLADVFVFNKQDNILNVYKNDGNYNFQLNTVTLNDVSISNQEEVQSLDINADGYTDLMVWDTISGNNKWYINDRNLFENLSFTLVNNLIPSSQFARNNTDGIRMPSFRDLNADGLSDLIIGADKNDDIYIYYVNTGSNTFSPNNGSIPSELFEQENVQYDFNSDGLPDLIKYDNQTKSSYWYKNTSTVFPQKEISYELVDSNIISPFLMPPNAQFKVANLNKDGIPDLIVYSGYSGYGTFLDAKFFINKGGFVFTQVDNDLGETDISISPGDYYMTPIDINGDGADDLFSYKYNTGINKIYFNNGEGVFLKYNPYLGGPDYIYNGFRYNMIQPHLIKEGGGIKPVNYRRGNLFSIMWSDVLTGFNRIIDLEIDQRTSDVLSITNGHGKTISINYDFITNDSIYNHGNLAEYPERDFIGSFKVVKEYKEHDDNETIKHMSYCYGNGRMHMLGKGLRGFREFEIKDEIKGTKDIYHRETDDKYTTASLYKIEKFQPTGELYRLVNQDNKVDTLHSPSGNPDDRIYFTYPQKTEETSYTLEENFISKITKRQFLDSLGNAIYSVVDYGNGVVDSTHNYYQDNYEKWYLSRLTKTEIFRQRQGFTPLKREVEFEYDPISGLITKEISDPNVDTKDRVEKKYTYDDFGNILKSTTTAWDGNQFSSRSLTSVYDSTARFAVQSINDLGHTTSMGYDPITGLEVSSSDINGLITTYAYDGMSRPSSSANPDGTWSKNYYIKCDGSCPENAVFFTLTETKEGNYTKTYYDAFDREVRKESNGFDGLPVVVLTEYDESSRVSRVSDPHYINEVPVWTEYTYDIMDRVVATKAPGDIISSVYYNGLTQVATNPLGQTKTTVQSADGRVEKILDNLNSEINYKYDIQKNLVEIIDHEGNSIKMNYDLLGYKTSLDDPDMGTYEYEYNRFGEIIKQIYPNGDSIEISYDTIGRMVLRQEKEGPTSWFYDNASNGIGLLDSINSYNYQASYTFDNLSRPISETSVIEDESYTYSFNYDTLGRLYKMLYPADLTIRYQYNENNYLTKIIDDVDNTVYYELEEVNAIGLKTKELYGNGVQTINTFDDERRFLLDKKAVSQNTTIQHLSYEYDNLQNLQKRTNWYRGITESFTYDGLNRLTSYIIPEVDSTYVEYDLIGNITYKSDVGRYYYGERGAGPHQVSSIEGDEFLCIPSALTEFRYTSFNKVDSLWNDSLLISLKYGHNRQRVLQHIFKNDSLLSKKIYVSGNLEISFDSSGLEQRIYYIRAGGEVIAVKNVEESTSKIHYWHKDHLGSLQSVSNENGDLIEDLYYDPWGLRRNWDGSVSDSLLQTEYDRGYTGHEHIDLFMLINMNGRIQDPVIGRFISPDPIIQSPTNLQSLNRYSYVFNNPLKYTDPSGFIGAKPGKWNSKGVIDVAGNTTMFSGNVFATDIFDTKVTRSAGYLGLHPDDLATLVVVAATVAGSFAGVPWLGAAIGAGLATTAVAYMNGSSFSDALNAGLKAAVITAASAYVSGYIGQWSAPTSGFSTATNVAIKTLGHGVTQGLVADVQGGKFEHGFWTGVATAGSEYLTDNLFRNPNNPSLYGNKPAIYAVNMTIGGTMSEMSGGKFANGAASAFIITAFNQMQSQSTAEKQSKTEKTIDAVQTVADVQEFKTDRINQLATKAGAKVPNGMTKVGKAAGVLSKGIEIGKGIKNTYNAIKSGQYSEIPYIMIETSINTINPIPGISPGTSLSNHIRENVNNGNYIIDF